MRKTWKLKMILLKVPLLPEINYDKLLMSPEAQKILRDLKSKISSQSKKNFVLEKDVRYLDSRIALLIQNRMALEEVRRALHTSGLTLLTGSSKMKLLAISKMLQIYRKVSFPMTRRPKNMGICFSSFNQSLDILHTCAV